MTRRSSLPGILGEIAEVVGAEAALAIAREKGGVRVDIPPRPLPDHWLTKCVGIEAAESICRHFSVLDADGRLKGVRHEIVPLGPTSVLTRARRTAGEALAAGIGVREAARAAGLHERTVFRLRKRLANNDDDGQGNLF